MAVTTRPATIPLPPAAAFPPELLEYHNFTAYDLEPREGTFAKMPINPHNGRRAKSNDPSTWGTFAEAHAYAERHGMGVMLMIAPPLFGYDIDDCYEGDTLSTMAATIVVEMGTYAERSVSRKGIKGIGIGKKRGTRCRRKGLNLELYDHARPFALTGDRLPDAPPVLADCQEALDHLESVAFPEPPPAPPVRGPVAPTDEDAAAIIDWLTEHRPAFLSLWRDPHGQDPSADDLALCNLLAWRTGDPARVDRLFRDSGKMRPKWDERRGQQTYGERTVAKAFEGRSSFYAPPAPRPAPSPRVAPGVVTAPGVGADVDPDLAAYLQMEHEALARLALAEHQGRVAEQERRQAEEERRQKVERFNRVIIAFGKTKAIRKQKPTIQAALFVYGSKSSRGDVDAEGWARTSRAELAEVGGVSLDAAGDHLDDIARWGVGIEKRVVKEDYELIDSRGQTSIQARPRLEIRVNGDVVDKLEELCVFTPPPAIDKATGEEKDSWGGKRTPCPDCGSLRRVRIEACADCGHEFSRKVIEPDPDTPLPGPITPADVADALVVDEADELAPCIPPERVKVSTSRPTYPAGEVTYHAAPGSPAGEEDGDNAGDAWDWERCNWPGCTERLKLGQKFCDFHKERPFARKPTGIPLIAQQPLSPAARSSPASPLVLRARPEPGPAPGPEPPPEPPQPRPRQRHYLDEL